MPLKQKLRSVEANAFGATAVGANAAGVIGVEVITAGANPLE